MKTDATFIEAAEWVRGKKGRRAERNKGNYEVWLVLDNENCFEFQNKEGGRLPNQRLEIQDLDRTWTLHPAPVKYRHITWQQAVHEVNEGSSKVECLFRDWKNWTTYEKHTLTLYELPETAWRIKIEDGEDNG